MNYLVLVVLAALGLLLQSTLLVHFTIAGVTPDIILVLVIFYSILQGPKKGLVVGFLLGMLEDLYFGRYIGMNALSKGITGLTAGWITGGAFSENLLVPIVSLFLGTFFNQFLYFLLGNIAGLNWSFSLLLWKAVPLAIYNMCLVPFTYTRFFHWVMKDDSAVKSSFWGRFS